MPADPGFTLRSHTIGALPVVNHVLRRLRIEALLHEHLPSPAPHTPLPPGLALGVLLRNLVLARVPLYGLGEWAGPCWGSSPPRSPSSTTIGWAGPSIDCSMPTGEPS